MSIKERLTRGHKKKARTFEQLVDAAVRVFARQEANDTSFLDIANEAQVASGTVHNYFKSKAELIEAAALKLVEQIRRPIHAIFGRVVDPAEQLAVLIRLALLKVADDPVWGAAMLRLAAATRLTGEKLMDTIPDILEVGRSQRRLAFGDPLAARVLVSGAILAGMHSVLNGEASSALGEDLAEHCLLALGLSGEEAASVARRPIPRSLG